MDALSRLHPTARGLLTLVDDTLTRNGCRDDHPIWPLLREAGRLPGDALTCAAGWLPDELDTRADLLARHQETEANAAAALTDVPEWEGDASSAFHTRLAAARNDLAHLEETGRLMHDWFTDLSAYLRQARLRLAHTLASALRSTEAVTLKIGPLPGDIKPTAQAEAAATIGAVVLTEVAAFWQGSVALSHHWSSHIATTPQTALVHAAFPTSTNTSTTLRADL